MALSLRQRIQPTRMHALQCWMRADRDRGPSEGTAQGDVRQREETDCNRSGTVYRGYR